MHIDIEHLNLPKVSQAGMRILDVLSKDDYSINDVADVAAEDPTLSGMLIKYANSPLYRRYAEISSVRKAVSLLGVKNVKLVVTLAAMRSFSAIQSVAIEKLWEHSFGIAVLCKLIATKACRQYADDLEFTGIIHDIDTLTMAANYSKEYDELVKSSCADDIELESLEDDRFEFSREQLINWVAESLHLPAAAVVAIKAFNSIEPSNGNEAAEKQKQVLEMAHLLDREVRRSEQVKIIQRVASDQSTLQASLSLSDADIEEIVAEFKDVLNEHFLL